MAEPIEWPARGAAHRGKPRGGRSGKTGSSARRRGKERAAAILDAAEALFAERGYAETTMRMVARAVGVKDPSLYNHFASKDALYSAVLERTYNPIGEKLEILVRGEASWAELGRAILSIREVFAKHSPFARLLHLELLGGGRRLHPVLRRWLESLFQRGREAVERLPVGTKVDQEERLLRLLALTNVVLGCYTSASVYELLGGRDLLSDRVGEKQDRVLRIILEAFERTPPHRRAQGPRNE